MVLRDHIQGTAKEERVAAREAISVTIQHVERKYPGYLQTSLAIRPLLVVMVSSISQDVEVILGECDNTLFRVENLSLKRIVHVTKLKSPLVQL